MTLLLTSKFKLNFVEIVSVATAFELIPEIAYYWLLATSAMMQNDTLPDHFRGRAIGHLFTRLAFHFYRKYQVQTRKQEVRRYGKYSQKTIPSRQEFKNKVYVRVVLCLHVWMKRPKRPSKIDIEMEYNNIMTLWKQKLKDASGNNLKDGVGDLAAIHSMAIHSELGLLPAWVRDEAHISGKSRYMDHFAETYALGTMTKARLESVVADLQAAMKFVFGITFSKARIENLLCKVFRLTSSTAELEKFCDLLIPDQPLFKFDSENIQVHIRRPL